MLSISRAYPLLLLRGEPRRYDKTGLRLRTARCESTPCTWLDLGQDNIMMSPTLNLAGVLLTWVERTNTFSPFQRQDSSSCYSRLNNQNSLDAHSQYICPADLFCWLLRQMLAPSNNPVADGEAAKPARISRSVFICVD